MESLGHPSGVSTLMLATGFLLCFGKHKGYHVIMCFFGFPELCAKSELLTLDVIAKGCAVWSCEL